ncbi:MAG TPA: GNAT family N-acetyltransferase [Rhabdochlamydiaceae bacterium]|jgi:GNAT superfamily N-acetyltransferase
MQAFLDMESVYIDVLWVEKNLQKQGYGTKLLDAAERKAIKNGCIFSTVDTWDFQSEEFYLKTGYERAHVFHPLSIMTVSVIVRLFEFFS